MEFPTKTRNRNVHYKEDKNQENTKSLS